MEISRRRFLKYTGSAVGLFLLENNVACVKKTPEFITEQEFTDGKICTLKLPKGEQAVDNGSFSLFLPEGYLAGRPQAYGIIKNQERTLACTLEIQNYKGISSLDLKGELIVTKLFYDTWGIRINMEDLQTAHTYTVEWEKRGAKRLIWDGRELKPKEKIPSTPSKRGFISSEILN